MGNTNIKIKSIELDAFRGFRDKVVFDFVTDSGEPANFVAIYAPNGFGKTSFFDGVEWAVTGSIERLIENPKVKNIAKETGGFILKNKDAQADKGTVTLIDENDLYFTRYTSSSENWDLLPGRNESKSTSPLKNALQTNQNRRIEILPQSRIDSFLSSTTPEEKYVSLLDFWGGKDDSSYYVGVSRLIEYNTENIGKINDEIEQLGVEISSLTSSESKTSKFNSIVRVVNTFDFDNEKIEEFSSNMSDSDFERIIGSIIRKNSFIGIYIGDKKDKKEKLIAVASALQKYQTNVRDIQNVEAEISRLNNFLLDFDQKQRLLTESQELESQIVKLKKDIDEAEQINSFKGNYTTTDTDIKSLTKERNDLAAANLANVKSRNEAREKKLNAENRISKVRQDEFQYNENFEKLGDLSRLIERNEQMKKGAEKRVELCKKIKRDYDSKISSVKSEISTVQIFARSPRSSIQNIVEKYVDAQKSANELAQMENRLGELQKELVDIEQDYRRTGSLDENLQRIIEMGRDFITQTHTDKCPLCNVKQSDFQQLLSLINIEKDDTLGLKRLTNNIQKLRADIDATSNAITQQMNIIVSILREQENQLNNRINSLSKRVEVFESFHAFFRKKISEIDAENSKYRKQYDEIENSNTFLKQALEDAEDMKQSSELTISNCDTIISSLNLEIQKNDNRAQEVEANLKLELGNNIYTRVNQYLEVNSIDRSIFLSNGLNSFITEKTLSLNEILSKTEEISQKIEVLNTRIGSLDKSEIGRQANQEKIKIDELRGQVQQFESQYYATIGEKNISAEVLTKETEQNEKAIRDAQDLEIRLKELQDNIDFIRQNIRLISCRNLLIQKEQELQNLNDINENLTTLKNEISDFLKQKINSVFNQEIINDIYKKIDPHPDFKEIQLVPEFEGTKPKLNIKAANSAKTNIIDPVLYLSSAQLNILSLSIFLAKALQNKSTLVNTIFMDDPIQYLDSINILSFIDLLRSVTSDRTINRQIVISTHDEDFFNLLKKKLSPNFYNTKFIEFETYGQLKN